MFRALKTILDIPHGKQCEAPIGDWYLYNPRTNGQSIEAAYKKVPPLQPIYPKMIGDTPNQTNQVQSVPYPTNERLHPQIFFLDLRGYFVTITLPCNWKSLVKSIPWKEILAARQSREDFQPGQVVAINQ